MHIPLDRKRMTGRMPWGLELPLRPFFGVMAVAPPAAWGSVSTLPPRKNGGNLDNKELVAGTTLYLPIHVDDALFSVGDGHGVQGDGEVCVTAIETGLVGTFELIVRDDLHIEWPRAETPTHVMTMAFDPDLDDCVVIALRQMIELVAKAAGIKKQEAYTLCSLAADVRVTQVVNGSKGIHVMLDKRYLAQKKRERALRERRMLASHYGEGIAFDTKRGEDGCVSRFGLGYSQTLIPRTPTAVSKPAGRTWAGVSGRALHEDTPT